MTSVQNIVLSVAALVAALVQLLFEAAFQGHASKARQHGRRPGRSADGHQQPRGTGEQVSLSGQALVRLCRGLQEELRRKDKELTTCKVSTLGLPILTTREPFQDAGRISQVLRTQARAYDAMQGDMCGSAFIFKFHLVRICLTHNGCAAEKGMHGVLCAMQHLDTGCCDCRQM